MLDLDPGCLHASRPTTLNSILREIGATMKKETSLPEILALIVIMLTTSEVSSQGLNTGSATRKFKAAVYAHAAVIPNDETPVTREKALEVMRQNLDVYSEQARAAHNQDVDILIFPEDGVFGMRFDRDTILPYLEYLPDPSTETWIPCDQPGRYNVAEVQIALSCMAKENLLYLVANIGDKQPCDPGTDRSCPQDGRYQYNTDVAYGPDGKFLAKYHKYNLFFEDQFDTPAPTHVYFDTPFGRFGMMTCFDVIFREPGIPLVEKYNVTNIAFPTAWMDALPLFPAIGFHSSFARAHRVNFLAANIHLPQIRFDGSGLYAPDGARGFHYSSTVAGDKAPNLVVAEMDVIDRPTRRANQQTVKSTDRIRETPGAEFQSSLFGDEYTFKSLSKPSGKVGVCQGKICCDLEYVIEEDTFTTDELFAFGAFDGLHTKEGNYYLQNCALVKCVDAKNKSSCGSPTVSTSTVFTKVSLRGQLQTKYVYPQLIIGDYQGNLAVSEPGAWSFTGSAIETSGSFRESVLSALLVGREYGRDDGSDGDTGSRLDVSRLLLLSGLVGVAFAVVLQADN